MWTRRLANGVLRHPISSLDERAAAAVRIRHTYRTFAKQVAAVRRTIAPAAPRRQTPPSLPDAEILIVVPPFASLYIPSLGAHTLQACVAPKGIRVHVLYANMMFAEWIGEASYNEVAWEPIGPLAAERLFARWAFGAPPLGANADRMFELSRMFGDKQAQVYGASLNMASPRVNRGYQTYQKMKVRRLRRLEATAGEWLDRIASIIANSRIPIVGCTTTFEQTVCSVALIDRIKQRRPDVVTIIGGANCEGEMAHGIESLDAPIDYIFSGECDEIFPDFIDRVLRGERPSCRIITGRPCDDMNARPTPRFHEFFEQRARHLPHSARSSTSTYLTYETSRGCWWGQKQHCTFCGLNGEGMASRRKDPARVVDELRTLTREHPTRNIGMADNIMPHEYFWTLLPQLSREVPNLHMFYEQKANLSLAQVMALKEAGITTIQPGIEALSTPMLQLMKKGVQAWQNLLLLRYVRIAGIRTLWSVLCGFPGDSADVYRDTVRISRLIHHLPPPTALWHLTIDRFSPYFTRPQEFAVRNITPYPAYTDVFPARAATAELAYHFVAEYDSAADRHLDVIREIGEDLAQWRCAWTRPYGRRPELKIEPLDGSYVLIDTRALADTEPARTIGRDEASLLLFHRRYSGSADEDLAIARKLAVAVDGWFVPLPVARIDHLFDLLGNAGEELKQRTQLEELAARRHGADVGGTLVGIACSGPLSALDHPLAPQ